MQGKYKQYIRNMDSSIRTLAAKGQSALILGPRQTGKTFLIKTCLSGAKNLIEYPLQNPEIRLDLERDPAVVVRQIRARADKPLVFVDEAQKVPGVFDSIQYLIDEKKASFFITGSSARKLRRKGVNLLPGRVRTFRLDPLSWNEFGWLHNEERGLFGLPNLNAIKGYSFEKSLVFGSLPGIVGLTDDQERAGLLKSYTQTYLEEEIRAEALSRKIGQFGRFLELAARESGTNPNLTKLSLESGVSVPTIKEYFQILEDTLVVEKVEPYLKNARKRILTSPRYYFFDTGVRNALARVPLTAELLNADKGTLFEHAVILELIRRIRAQHLDYKVHYWRTSGGAEVDCVIDTGKEIIPIEIKSGAKVALSGLRGLTSFIETYKGKVKRAFVITTGRVPEQLSDIITALPWQYL